MDEFIIFIFVLVKPPNELKAKHERAFIVDKCNLYQYIAL